MNNTTRWIARTGAVALVIAAWGFVKPARGADAKPTPAAPWTFVDPLAPRERELNFPTAFSAGALYVRPWKSNSWDDWKAWGEARGAVKIPREKSVRLDISPRSAAAPEFLEGLPADALTALNMGKAEFSPAQLRRLSGLTGLKILNLRGTPTNDEGMAYLEPLVNLETLYLDNTQVTDLGLGALKGMKNLVHLGLGSTTASRTLDGGIRILPRISDAGLASLNGFVELQYVNLAGSEATERGLENLKAATKLYYLGLDRTRVGDGLGKMLAGWPVLLELHAQGTKLTDAAFENIEKVKFLRVIDLSGTRITPATLDRFKGSKKVESLAIALTFKVGRPEIETISTIAALRTLILAEGQADQADLDALKKAKPTLEIKIAKPPPPAAAKPKKK